MRLQRQVSEAFLRRNPHAAIGGVFGEHALPPRGQSVCVPIRRRPKQPPPKRNAGNYIKTPQQIARGMFGYWFSAGGLEKSNTQACSPAHHLTLWSGNKETVSAKTLNAAQKFGRRNNLDWRIRESHHVTSDNYICAPGLRGGNLKRILKIRMLCPKI